MEAMERMEKSSMKIRHEEWLGVGDAQPPP